MALQERWPPLRQMPTFFKLKLFESLIQVACLISIAGFSA
jgi:hypothetical protein